jgi:anti-sigma factor RsiW
MVAAWQAQRDALRNLHAEMEDRPLPVSLVAAAERAQRTREQMSQWWRWGGMAASLLLAFGMGWFASSQLRSESAGMARVEPARQFAQQAAVAYAVFQPEVRHPVEVTAAQHEHLVQWLSKRLGRSLKVPVLTAHGYELVGGRLLPGDDGARAQFMYQNSSGQRITLYLEPKSGTAAMRANRFPLRRWPRSRFYWSIRLYYAISGTLPRRCRSGPAAQPL